MPRRSAQADWFDRIVGAAASTAVNTIIGVLGVAIPIFAWVAGKASIQAAVLAIETVLLISVVVRHQWLRHSYLQLRRANSRSMSDSVYFDAVRVKLENELLNNFDEVADGHLQVFASEVPRISILLVSTLMDSQVEPKKISATDLTIDPRLLSSRREYLAINRRFIEAGGTILRIFICRLLHLTTRDFAEELLALIDYHRGIGVQCGLAVRDWLRPMEAVDFVVIASAAVLIEDEQGDLDYRRGRSSISFKGVEKWAERFDEMWQPHLTLAPPVRLQHYEAEVRRMLAVGDWDQQKVEHSLGRHEYPNSNWRAS